MIDGAAPGSGPTITGRPPEAQVDLVVDRKPEPPVSRPTYTPLFRAQHEDRYRRRDLISDYEAAFGCNLVVMIDQISEDSVTFFQDVLHGLDPTRDLHVLLCSPGGDGEVAIRLARMAQHSCRELVVLVPEIAKSAATIFALAAHRIVMGATSDLGPIDPQVLVGKRGFVSAKDLIGAVERAMTDVAERPDTYPLHAAMFGGIDSTVVEFARSALARADQMARQAISSNPDRDTAAVDTMCRAIGDALINDPSSHGAVIGATEARRIGLPVVELASTRVRAATSAGSTVSGPQQCRVAPAIRRSHERVRL
ncbi:SDH family Clp fold serine proteinase [Saccharothrix hoggarensis]|uniref:Serine dehydrogenase proteinase n=1 Tax=Saccharothrix hoggarensis TaxID=913853 RepID=A0ABW3QHJ3_9PSEU